MLVNYIREFDYLQHHDIKSIDCAKTRIACQECQIMLNGDCRDPQVILRNWSSFSSRLVFEFAIAVRSLDVTGEDGIARREIVDSREILLCSV